MLAVHNYNKSSHGKQEDLQTKIFALSKTINTHSIISCCHPQLGGDLFYHHVA